MLGLIGKSFLIDTVIESFNLCKYFTIITSEPEKLCRFIFEEMHHGATLVDVVGGYSDKEKKMILTVCRRFESVRLKNRVHEIDPGAFMMITNSSEIIGRGFRGTN